MGLFGSEPLFVGSRLSTPGLKVNLCNDFGLNSLSFAKEIGRVDGERSSRVLFSINMQMVSTRTTTPGSNFQSLGFRSFFS